MGDNNEEKEDKPKKAFLIKVIVWTDGEVDTDIREYKKLGTGRGAPTLCGPLNADEFSKALSDVLISHGAVCKAVSADIGLDKNAYKSKDANTDNSQVEAELIKTVKKQNKEKAIEDKEIPTNLDFNIDEVK